MPTKPAAIALAGLLVAACGRGGSDGDPAAMWSPERQAEVVRELEQLAPPRVAQQVLRGCDRWHSLDRPCRDADVRVHSLECWVAKGRAAMEIAYRANIRERARDLNILRAEDQCMLDRGWRRNQGGSEFGGRAGGRPQPPPQRVVAVDLSALAPEPGSA
jgi:hypothetical protein